MENKTKPIRPEEVIQSLENIIPEWVIKGINEAIRENYRGSSFTIKQPDLIKFMIEQAPGPPEGELPWETLIHRRKWLDFEPLYENFGWKITYDKPGYNETYDPTFEFKPL